SGCIDEIVYRVRPAALQHVFAFVFNGTATTEIYTLSLHDALPIFTTTTYPVTDAGGVNPIFLSTLSSQAANYPNQTQLAAFANAMNFNQPLQAGPNTVKYSAYAELMSMVSILPFGTATPVSIRTSNIIDHGQDS